MSRDYIMDNQVGYSLLTIKEISDDQRVIRGMATTPDPDRVGDIVDPMGASFGKNLPLLWMHDHKLPVGTVNFGQPTKKGIPFEARIPKVSNPSGLKARIDEAWESVKAGLIRAVSIGFRPLEYSVIEETGGLRFVKSEIFELSLVSVPANAGATITEIKALDQKARAASGVESLEIKEKTASDMAKTVKTVKLNKEKEMSLSEKLKGFKEKLAQVEKSIVEMAENSVESGETFDSAQQDEYDNLQAEQKALSEHIKRTEDAIAISLKSAKAVDSKAITTEKSASDTRQGFNVTVKAVAENVPGLGMARAAKAMAISRQSHKPAVEVAKQLWPDHEAVTDFLEKAAVPAGNTTDNTWAKPLVRQNNVAADFAEYLRPATILGKFGQGGIPALRNVPFRTALLGQTTGGDAYWVGEGQAKPLTKFDFESKSLDPLKVAAISVLTKELIWDSSPSAELLVRDGLRDALAARLDQDFINPTITAISNVRPASITNGVSAIPSSGATADDIRCDIQKLLAQYIAANNAPTTGVIIMSSARALAVSMLQNPLGQAEFAGLTMNGGVLLGFPVIVSDYVPADSSGDYVVMVNASDIYIGEGEIMMDMSDQASLQMDNAPDNPTTATTVLVSLWQRNMVGFLIEKRINYMKRRPSAVAVLNGVNWGSC